MARDLTGGMSSAIAAQEAALVHFISLAFSGGKVYLTTGPHDIVWDSQTWQGVGGALFFEAITESGDEKASGVPLHLSGCDQAILAVILGQSYRGRKVEIYLAHIDTDGAIVADPELIFDGYMNAGFRIVESRDDRGAGTVDISSRIVGRLAELALVRTILMNLGSHQVHQSTDTFFQHVAQLPNRPIYWGTKGPSLYSPGQSPPGGPYGGPDGSGWH